ncbi:MAG: sigma-70 family RNA polymerase sigma factor [Phycisphaerae bacterium]|nr:sigma-70 family RNA polymerase sigma factor [Phycisphaerae bacterium]
MSDTELPNPARKPTRDRTEVTELLQRARAGDALATDELFPRVYGELRQLAERFLSDERACHTLQPTALVNEAYLRLVGPADSGWENKAHFFGAAAKAIRRILTDHARARNAAKRGRGAVRHEATELAAPDSTSPIDAMALDTALDRLSALDPGKARIVELRYFAGLTVDETARVMGVSPSSIAREWAFIRVWLHRELSGEGA